MKKIISSLAIALTLTIGFTGISIAQDSILENEVETSAQDSTPTNTNVEETSPKQTVEEEKLELTFVQTLKQKYIEGEVLWMTPV